MNQSHFLLKAYGKCPYHLNLDGRNKHRHRHLHENSRGLFYKKSKGLPKIQIFAKSRQPQASPLVVTVQLIYIFGFPFYSVPHLTILTHLYFFTPSVLSKWGPPYILTTPWPNLAHNLTYKLYQSYLPTKFHEDWMNGAKVIPLK